MGDTVSSIAKVAAPIAGFALGGTGGALAGSAIGSILGANEQAGAAYDAAKYSGDSQLQAASIAAKAQLDAAKTSSDAQLQAAKLAAEEARFRPVGITNRFGSSNFGFDANGRLSSAGYNLSPELQRYQDYLSQQTQAGLGDTSRLLSLGRQYIGEDPNAVRKRYIDQQTALIAPQNEQALAGIRNKLFQTGRQGLATGATTAGGLAATNPEMAAYYNALAQQQNQLAAGAEQAAQQQVAYGQGLLSSAYSPFQTSLGLMGNVENLGMQPLTIGSELGGRALQGSSQAANALMQGGMGAAGMQNQAAANAANIQNAAAANAARGMQGAMGYSPWGSALSGLAGNQQFAQGIAGLFGGGNRQASIGNVMPNVASWYDSSAQDF